MSRDCKNDSKFIFGVDYRRLIKEKSRFGNLLNTTYLDRTIKKDSEVRTLNSTA